MHKTAVLLAMSTARAVLFAMSMMVRPSLSHRAIHDNEVTVSVKYRTMNQDCFSPNRPSMLD